MAVAALTTAFAGACGSDRVPCATTGSLTTFGRTDEIRILPMDAICHGSLPIAKHRPYYALPGTAAVPPSVAFDLGFDEGR